MHPSPSWRGVEKSPAGWLAYFRGNCVGAFQSSIAAAVAFDRAAWASGVDDAGLNFPAAPPAHIALAAASKDIALAMLLESCEACRALVAAGMPPAAVSLLWRACRSESATPLSVAAVPGLRNTGDGWSVSVAMAEGGVERLVDVEHSFASPLMAVDVLLRVSHGIWDSRTSLPKPSSAAAAAAAARVPRGALASICVRE
jgi:hypothetical protein